MSQDHAWWRGGVIYQIYPLSFRDSDGDGRGDLRGVIEKLDHLAELGVDGLWLSPFFPSPMKDFGYDVSDYKGVDPQFGTLADFDNLLARAHGLSLKVIIDQVYSHTSDAHPWFKQSAADRRNPKADWYVWADAKPDGTPPNNWQASFGGPSWTWSARRGQYFMHNFLPSQPDLNFWQPAVREAILDVADFWLDRGVDGLRLDVVNYYFHDRSLADNPPASLRAAPDLPARMQRHIHDRSQPETLSFIAELRHRVDRRPGRMMVGEVVDSPALPRQIEYTAGDDRLHTAYSFHFLSATRGTPELFRRAIEAWVGVEAWPSWSLGNHDVARFASRLAGDEPAHAKVLMAALLCLPGTIFLYQGEELGLPQAQVPFDRLADPFAIAAWTGDSGRDGARTPMPWTSAGSSAGFSASADTWLPLDPRHRPLAVDVQQARGDSTLAFTRRALDFRRENEALKVGAASVLASPGNILAFERRHSGERLVCVFELEGSAAKWPSGGGDIQFSVTGAERLEAGMLQLPAFGGAILRAKNAS